MRSAIDAFIRVTGWQVGYSSSSVTGKTSRAVIGEMTPVAALAKLVDGTGVSAKITGPSTAALVDNIEASGSSAAEAGATVLDTIVIQGNAETAVSPVDGYVATVSGAGTKSDTPIMQTPQSISVVGRKEMEDRGVQSVSDALNYTPSFTSETYGQVSNGVEHVKLRGFDSPSQYLDGVLSNGFLEPYGLERIEVLRGPASILYGQANPGGLISSVSKRPTDQPIREVGLMTSQYGGIQGFFDFGGKIDKDGQFLYRLTGLGKNLGTSFENGSRYQRVYIAPAITWQPDADTKLTILAKYQYDPRLLSLPNVPYEGSIKPRPDGFRYPQNWYNSDPAYDKGSYRRSYQIGYDFEHRFNDVWSIQQNLRYEQVELNRQYLTALPFPNSTTVGRTAQHLYEETKIFSVDTHAQAEFSTGPLQHVALFGIDYRHNDYLSKSGCCTVSVPGLNVFDPVYGVFSGPAPELTSGTDQKSWQLGLYAQDQIKWDRWTLMIGGRYDWADSKTYDAFNDRSLTDEMNQHAFTKRAGLVYEFDNGFAPYVSYSESFQPQAGTDRGGNPFDPTTGRQYEAGLRYKPTFVDALFTVAVYDLRKQNVTTTDPVDSNYSVQTGEIASRGIEFTGSANVTDNLRLTASYSYLDNEITKDNVANNVGKWPNGIPRNQASAWVDYTFDYGVFDGLGLGAGVRYLGKSPGDNANTIWNPAATLVDAAIRYDFGKKFPDLKGLQLSVNATNLLDKEYAKCVGSTYICYYGSGRTVFGTLTYRW